jgi:diaminopimelate epimerase
VARLIKAHAYGNDFLLEIAAVPGNAAERARAACDRHHGVGADGLVFVHPTKHGATTHLFNADGSRAEVSGNGVRCVAAWLAFERDLPAGETLAIETDAGMKMLTLLETGGPRLTFRADMGEPADIVEREIVVHGERVIATVLSMGNPQCVVFGDVTDARLQEIGGPIATHQDFVAGTNVELATFDGADRLRIMIWERGVGPTSSSGTGTCAAAVAAIAHHGAPRRLHVRAPGGSQEVTWTDEGVFLTGWAELVASVDWPVT